MNFRNVPIKTFGFSDLIGKTLKIKCFKDSGTEIIVGIDTASGDMFVLKENIFPKSEPNLKP